MIENYDSSWDSEEKEDGNVPSNEDPFDKVYDEWEERSWEPWLRINLQFPFPVKRMEDLANFTEMTKSKEFGVGHTMNAIDIEMEDELCGIILKVREGKRVGQVPLCEVKVLSKENDNFWPVREYAVWFANS